MHQGETMTTTSGCVKQVVGYVFTKQN